MVLSALRHMPNDTVLSQQVRVCCAPSHAAMLQLEDGALACAVCGGSTESQNPSAVKSSWKALTQPPPSCFMSWCQICQQPGVQEGEHWNCCGKEAQQWWFQFSQEQIIESESSTITKHSMFRGIIHTFSLQVIGTPGTLMRYPSLNWVALPFFMAQLQQLWISWGAWAWVISMLWCSDPAWNWQCPPTQLKTQLRAAREPSWLCPCLDLQLGITFQPVQLLCF